MFALIIRRIHQSLRLEHTPKIFVRIYKGTNKCYDFRIFPWIPVFLREWMVVFMDFTVLGDSAGLHYNLSINYSLMMR